MPTTLARRDFLKTFSVGVAGWAAAATTAGAPAFAAAAAATAQTALPRWRGFNLTNFFQALGKGETGDCTLKEDDLRWMCDWGFDFVRLPMDYWLWIDSDCRQSRTLRRGDELKIKESTLAQVDRAVELCGKYQLHVNLNFHRAPGYCINNPEREPFVLWKDPDAEDAFVYHWEVFAKRYAGVPESQLSFNLVNEAPTPREGYMTRADYARVMMRVIEKIRQCSPKRIVLIDGLSVGNEVVTEMIPAGVGQSVHAYWPGGISHYRASWVDKKSDFPTPTWPLKKKNGTIEGRPELEKRYLPWAELARKGVGVHCGECGCYNKTPYAVFTAWMTDVLDVLTGHGIGYALWNFRGSFGVVDSGRQDIDYERWHGHKLDRKLLTLLQKY